MDKSGVVSGKFTFLANCGVAPLCVPAHEAETRFADAQREQGSGLFAAYGDPVKPFRASAAELLGVTADGISFTKSTAEGLNIIANGYPFAPGDEVITYVHEYPSNFYPWVMQERRGVVVRKLANYNPLGPEFSSLPVGWSIDELRKLITPRTRIVALSQVQFHSGFGADLSALGQICREKKIDLILDVAQSLGGMPVRESDTGAAAIVGSGWKWLLGPIGSGIFYTSPALRSKLEITLSGPDMMRQGDDYLNHTWNPFDSGKRFEYSTTPFGLAQGLHGAISGVHLRAGPEAIWKEIQRLQDIVLENVSPEVADIASFPGPHRSPILSLRLKRSETASLVKRMFEQKVIVSARGGYLRVAPHFFVTDDELLRAVQLINELGSCN